MRLRSAAVGLLVAGAVSVATLAGAGASFAEEATTDDDTRVTVRIPDLPPSPPPVPVPSPSPSAPAPPPAGGGTTVVPPLTTTTSGTTPTTPGAGAPTEATAPTVPARPTTGAAGLVLTPRVASIGAVLTATGSGYTPGENVQIVVYFEDDEPRVLGSVVADQAGAISAAIDTTDYRVGLHTAEATGWVSGEVANGTFILQNTAAAPFSLFPWIIWVVAGLAILLVAGLLLLGLRLGWFSAANVVGGGSGASA